MCNYMKIVEINIVDNLNIESTYKFISSYYKTSSALNITYLDLSLICLLTALKYLLS